MKVCLVDAPVSREQIYGEWDLSALETHCPPLGLLSLAAVLLQEGEHLPELGGYVPRTEHVIHAQLLLLGVDADRHFSALGRKDDDLGYVALNEIERAGLAATRIAAPAVSRSAGWAPTPSTAATPAASSTA